MRRLALALGFTITLFVPADASAQQGMIAHEPPECLPSEERPLLIAWIDAKGEPRAYFRRRGAEEWCWVVGQDLEGKPEENYPPFSDPRRRAYFVLPRFEGGTELEYYFITVDKGRTTAVSQVETATADQGAKAELAEDERPVTDPNADEPDDTNAVVTSKSPVLYVTNVSEQCTTDPARHVAFVVPHCKTGDTLMAAAYLLALPEIPMPISPSKPER